MKSSIIRVIALAGFAIALPLLSVSAPAVAKSKYECFADAWGNKVPCSSLSQQQNPNGRNPNDCFTDEGYGRYRPCDSLFKSRRSSRK